MAVGFPYGRCLLSLGYEVFATCPRTTAQKITPFSQRAGDQVRFAYPGLSLVTLISLVA